MKQPQSQSPVQTRKQRRATPPRHARNPKPSTPWRENLEIFTGFALFFLFLASWIGMAALTHTPPTTASTGHSAVVSMEGTL